MNEIILNNQILPVALDARFLEETLESAGISAAAGCVMMLYAAEGRLFASEAGINYEINAGDAAFFKESLKPVISAPEGAGLKLYFISFYMAGQPQDAYAELSKSYTVPKTLEGITGSVLDIKIRDYAGYFQNAGERQSLGINTALYDILCECVRLGRGYHSYQNNLSDEIISYLKEYSNQPLNTRDMEKRFYLTYKYMGTAFKKSTGKTILGYHTGLRMERARKLLVETSYGIDEISRQLGYSDALYFSRVFKKYCGQSPQIYRKARKQG